MLVTTESACQTGLPQVNLPHNTDHSGLVKYESKSDAGYVVASERLRRLLEEGPSAVGKRFAIQSNVLSCSLLGFF